MVEHPVFQIITDRELDEEEPHPLLKWMLADVPSSRSIPFMREFVCVVCLTSQVAVG